MPKPETITCPTCGIVAPWIDADGNGGTYPPCSGEKGPWFTRWVECPHAYRAVPGTSSDTLAAPSAQVPETAVTGPRKRRR